LANIKINYEIEMCQLKMIEKNLLIKLQLKSVLRKKELQERVKLAKFRDKKEM